MKALRTVRVGRRGIDRRSGLATGVVGAGRRDRRSRPLQRHAVAKRRSRARRAIARGRRQRVAAARVLVRRHRRRRVEDHRRWLQLDADDRRQDQHLVDRLARRLPVESRRRLHRRRRDAVARQHHPGRRRLQDQRRRREVGSPHRPPRLAGDRAVARASDQLRHRLCGGARPDLQRPPAARHLQDQRRRQDLAAHAVPRREDRRRGSVDRSEEPQRDLRVAVGSASHAVEHVERRPRQRPVQVHRRRRHLDRDHQEPGPARRPVGQGRRLGVGRRRQSRLHADRERSGRRPLCVRRRRRVVEADQRQPQHAPARLLLHAPQRRPGGQGHRLRPQRAVLPLDRRRQDHHQHPRAARRQPRPVDLDDRQPAHGAVQRRRRQRDGQRRPDVDRAGLSRPGSSTTCSPPSTCRITSAARSRTTAPRASAARPVRARARAACRRSSTPSAAARAATSRRIRTTSTCSSPAATAAS